MKKIILILILVIGGLWFAYSVLRPKAPLKDGLYLSYDYGGSPIRVTFSEISKNKFWAAVSPGDNQQVVNKRLITTGGRVYDAELLGPLWIPPSSVKVGGNAHGDRVVEVKRWQRWDVGVVKATFGAGGALRGEWYYEKNTGFLVGGKKSSVLSTVLSGKGGDTHFVLIKSNLENL